MRRVSTLCIVTLCVCAALPAQTGGARKRIAIMNFDYATVAADVNAMFGRQDIGKGIADLLVDRLVTDGRYSVIERKALDKLIAEQNFSNSDRADPTSAAKIGRLLGVEAIVIGSITQFGRDDKNTSVAGSGLGSLAGRYGLGGLGRKEAKAVVQISARLVNTDTGEILAVASGKGESNRSGTSLVGSGGSWGNNGSGGIDMSSHNFGETLIGEAVNKAVTEVATRLDNESGRLPGRVVVIEGVVADATGDTLVINVGAKAGVKVGDTLLVKRTTREIKDPTSGKVLRRMEDNVGTLKITEVDDQSAVGKLSGGGQAKVGDVVKSQ